MRDEDFAMGVTHQVSQLLLVIGVGIRIEKTDGHRAVRVAGERCIHHPSGSRNVQGGHNGAVRRDALLDLEGIRATDHRFRLLIEQVVNPLAVVALQLQQIAEPLGHEEGNPRALALEDGVGGDRRTVDQVLDRTELDAGGVKRRQRAFIGTRRRARHLGHGHLALIDRDEVRERPADFYPNPQLFNPLPNSVPGTEPGTIASRPTCRLSEIKHRDR